MVISIKMGVKIPYWFRWTICSRRRFIESYATRIWVKISEICEFRVTIMITNELLGGCLRSNRGLRANDYVCPGLWLLVSSFVWAICKLRKQRPQSRTISHKKLYMIKYRSGICGIVLHFTLEWPGHKKNNWSVGELNSFYPVKASTTFFQTNLRSTFHVSEGNKGRT